MAGGFTRYNEIQKALSANLKQQGLSLKDKGVKFHELASSVYHESKPTPLNEAIDNIDILTENFFEGPSGVPMLTSSQLQSQYFWDFNSIWAAEDAPGNLLINTFTSSETEIPATEFNYNQHFQEFTKFCNDSKGKEWQDSSDAPMFRFTEPVPHPKIKGKYISELISEDENDYGYIPGEEDLEFIPSEPREPEPEPEPEPPKPEPDTAKQKKIEKAKRKAEKRQLRIKQLDVESKKLDVQAKEKAIELFDRYERLYDKGIISKAEFKQKVMELKL